MIRTAQHIRQFVRENDLGEVYGGGTWFILTTGPETILAPDLAFVALGRIPSQQDLNQYLAPDLVVEVSSVHNWDYEIERKTRIYLEAGVRQFWVLYPWTRRVVVHQPGIEPKTYEAGDVIGGGDALPGFELPVARLFD